MTKVTREKVIAYITRGNNLLVFSHPHHPEAGIQVPAGTIKEGESPRDAVLREVREETGLHDLAIRAFLGVREVDLSSYGLEEIHRRHFFHLECHDETPATWRHHETDPGDGSPGPIEFEFFWVQLPDEVPELAGDQNALLSSVETPSTSIWQHFRAILLLPIMATIVIPGILIYFTGSLHIGWSPSPPANLAPSVDG